MQRERRAVAPPPGDLATDADDVRRSCGEIAREISVVFLVVRRRHQHVDIPAHHFGRRIPEQPFGTAIECFDSPPAVDDHDAVNSRIDDRAKSFVAVPQLIGVTGDLLLQLKLRRLQRIGRLALAPRIARREPPHDEEQGCVGDDGSSKNAAYHPEAIGLGRLLIDGPVNDDARGEDCKCRQNRDDRDRPTTVGHCALCSGNRPSLTQPASSLLPQ